MFEGAPSPCQHAGHLISAQVSFEISTGPDTSPLVAASWSSRIRRTPKRQGPPPHSVQRNSSAGVARRTLVQGGCHHQTQ